MHLDLEDILNTLHVVRIPLRTKFRGITSREIALFQGEAGWSEFSPFLEYGTQESSTWLKAALEFASVQTPPSLRTRIPVNATLPAVNANEVTHILKHYEGVRSVKIKVAAAGQHLQHDLERVRAVREFYGPQVAIRLDANGGWSQKTAVQAIRALHTFDLEYIEQPCATVDELAYVRERVQPYGVLIAADESIRKASDPYEVVRKQAADVLVLKVQPLGGISAVLELCSRINLPIVFSSALETSIGLSMGAFAAAAIKELRFDCGLGTLELFTDDVCAYPLSVQNGAIGIRRMQPNMHQLHRYAVSPTRYAWWVERIRACYSAINASST